LTDFLVTGTDTGIGKTVVAAGLLLALRRRDIRALGFKPTETGLVEGEERDSAILARASWVLDERTRPLLGLVEPLAPAVAAERAKATWDPRMAIDRVRELRGEGYTLVVEGAGGLLVPWAFGFNALDLAAELGLVAIVVARAGLGTLNHTLLTARALEGRGVPMRGVVLNRMPNLPGLAETTNAVALRRLLPGVRIETLPEVDSPKPFEIAERVAPLLDSLLDD
jgi:dethiobiotin synthetase